MTATEKNTSFICFDICEFHPSISKQLLLKTIEFTSKYDNITSSEQGIILQAKKLLLYNNNEPWCKRNNTDFDITKRSLDGAETCEMVGLYILSQLQHLGINVGLHRDDGLAACHSTARQTEITKKKICNIFAQNNLKITICIGSARYSLFALTFNLLGHGWFVGENCCYRALLLV